MSRISDEVKSVRRFVIFFDICSSTNLLEHLLVTENQHRWRTLLIRLETFLLAERDKSPFEIYKFLGDGWVLLFDDKSITGTDLMEFLVRLCAEYRRVFQNNISEVIGTNKYHVGLTFGIDFGTLVKFVMNQRDEYIGRALNVAARLHDAIKQRDPAPHGKLLISKNAFVRLGLSKSPKYAGTEVERELRNISEGKHYLTRKIVIFK